MLWDRGAYTYGGTDTDPEEGLRRGYQKGDLKFVLNGKRLKGSWVLVRMRRGQSGKPPWLLIKHRDEHAVPGSDVTADVQTSVATGRTMDEIAEGKSRVWRSNRDEPKNVPGQVGSGTSAKSQATKKPDSAYQRLMARRSR
jgi:bifunctional non-homologous end joining protein LigD